MSKPRPDSPVSALSEAQTETLEGWLFEEKLGCVEALERVEKEFGVKASHSAVGRFYQRAAARRAQTELMGVEQAIAGLAKIPLGNDAANRHDAGVETAHPTGLGEAGQGASNGHPGAGHAGASGRGSQGRLAESATAAGI